MKRLYFIITIASCLLPLAGMQAQRTLQIEAIPGQFAGQLTEEQMATVEELTLTGELCNSDFAALRSMKSLRVLDMTDAMVDTIPGYAFKDEISDETYPVLEKISLPKALRIIESYGFFRLRRLQELNWNKFPEKIGDHIFEGCYGYMSFTVSDNELTIVNDAIYTSDLKTLLLFPPYYKGRDYNTEYNVPYGTIKIGEKAFMDTELSTVILPETLQEIGEKSFWITPLTPTGNANRHYYEFLLLQVIISSPAPPVCHGDPFGLNIVRDRPSLRIPPEYKEAYEDDPYWKLFFEPVNMPSHKMPTASITWMKDGMLHFLNNDDISEIRLFNTNGSLAGVYETPCPATISLPQKGIYIAEITYKDGLKETRKLLY